MDVRSVLVNNLYIRLHYIYFVHTFKENVSKNKLGLYFS